jgi:hypothetical protein
MLGLAIRGGFPQLGEKARKSDVIVRQATMSVLVIEDLREGTK